MQKKRLGEKLNFLSTVLVKAGVLSPTNDPKNLAIQAPMIYQWFVRKGEEVGSPSGKLQRKGVPKGDKMPMLPRKQLLALYHVFQSKFSLIDFAETFECSVDVVRQWNTESDVWERTAEYTNELTNEYLARLWQAYENSDKDESDAFFKLLEEAEHFKSPIFHHYFFTKITSYFEDLQNLKDYTVEQVFELSFLRHILFTLHEDIFLADAKSAKAWYSLEAEIEKMLADITVIELSKLIKENKNKEALKFIGNHLRPLLQGEIDTHHECLYDLWVAQHKKRERKK